MSHLTYAEAIIVGLIQGTTELFPVSSLGHNVLIPALVGGSWSADLNVSEAESPYLAFVVGLHVATAIGITAYFWRDWVRIIGGFFSSIARREVRTPDQKLAWMIILATIPVGLVGLVFEHKFRVIFAVPSRAAIFLVANGIILYAGERFRTRRSRAADEQVAKEREAEPALISAGGAPGADRVAGAHSSGQRAVRQQEMVSAIQADRRLTSFSFWQAVIIGSAQILALLAGISRDGVTMVAGMFRGLSREDGQVRVPARDSRHPGCRRAQDPRPVRPPGQRHPAADPGRKHRLGNRRVPFGAVPDEVLPDQDADSVRDLLLRLRPRQLRVPDAEVAQAMTDGNSAPWT